MSARHCNVNQLWFSLLSDIVFFIIRPHLMFLYFHWFYISSFSSEYSQWLLSYFVSPILIVMSNGLWFRRYKEDLRCINCVHGHSQTNTNTWTGSKICFETIRQGFERRSLKVFSKLSIIALRREQKTQNVYDTLKNLLLFFVYCKIFDYNHYYFD